MKFELVDFYPITDKNRGRAKKNVLGTVHVYVIDYELDIRGIKVVKCGNNLHFLMPHSFGIDLETGENVKYPIFRFTKQTHHEELMDFLHQQVKPTIMEKTKNGKREPSKSLPRA
jgi:hypothetical protein